MIRQGTRIDWDAAKSRLRAAQRGLDRSATADDVRMREVYRQRAERAAAGWEGRALEETTPVLVVRAGGETYGVELSAVAQIFPRTRITPVPGAPPALVGVANLQGDILPIFGLRRLVSLPEADESTGEFYIVLLRGEHRRVGLQVEQIDGIRPLALGEMHHDDQQTENGDRYVRGRTREKVNLLCTARLLKS